MAEKPDNDKWMSEEDNRRRMHFRRRASRRERLREQAMRDWFGAGRVTEEVLAHSKGARPIRDEIERWMKSSGLQWQVLLDRLRNEWTEVAGADLARFTRPYAVQKNVLLVEVAHPTWLYVLEREHKPALVERVVDATDGQIDTVRLIPKGRQRPGNS